MNRIGEQILEVNVQGEIFKIALEKGDLKWDDEIIQFFLPLILYFTNFDWLKLVAENTLVEEDEIVVKNFLEMTESLIKINEDNLELSVHEKIKRLFGDL